MVYDHGEIELTTNSVRTCFSISPIKDVIVLKDDGTFSARDTLILDIFLVATVGALRGMMVKNLKGTPLEPYYLPLIPMENFRVKGKQ